MSDSNNPFSLTMGSDDVALVSIDVAGESQNVLQASFAEHINTLLDELQSAKAKGVIMVSGKPNSFIAGADISMLQNVTSSAEAEQIARTGQTVFNRIEKLQIPVVAAIHGPCLGGGMEFAMACHERICSDSGKTQLGLPEVQLGLLPGSGGTQRLPKLVGIAKALDMMLTGKMLRPKQALKAGLVSEVVAQPNLMKSAYAAVAKLQNTEKEAKSAGGFKQFLSLAGLQKLALETNPLGRKTLFEQARKRALKKSRGNYPAVEKIIDCVETGQEQGVEAGYAYEAKAFGELVMSAESKQLVNIFFASNELKKSAVVDTDVEWPEVQQVGVLGGGLMGAGIAYVSADKAGKSVRVKDRDSKGVANALAYTWSIYAKKLKRRFMSKADASEKISRLTGSTDYSGFKNMDLVIEAVFEDLELKHQMVKDVEKHCHKQTIFATNTSSIPISAIAAAAKRPEQVIGMHYFSPVEKMPLLEIIATESTADWVIGSAVELGRQQGKTVIVVKDRAGFYVNRILAPYMNEAGFLLGEGVRVDAIDKALVNAGFPVGPMTLLDEVGIDVATKVAPILQEEFGDRMAPPELFAKLIKDDRKGRKNQRGFYQYSGSKKDQGKNVDESIYSLLGVSPSERSDASEIVDRCLLQMVNEAARCLDEGIIRDARDGDIGAIFGIGFPPFLGGPFRYVDSRGAKAIVEKLESYQTKYGDRFEPARLLVTKAKSGEGFY